MPVIISVASGKGGVGKSVIVSNLALLLSRHFKRVVGVDLDIGGPDMHILFGVFHPQRTLTDFINRQVEDLEDVALGIGLSPGLRIIPGTGDTLATANLLHAKKKRLLSHIRRMEADVVLIDVGAGTSLHTLDFFLLADIHIVVAIPEPTSVLDLYRFIKLAAYRRLALALDLHETPTELILKNSDASLPNLIKKMTEEHQQIYTLAEKILADFRPHLIVNKSSDKSYLNILQLRKLVHDFLGGQLSVLGRIPDDPLVPRSVQDYLPIVELDPYAPAAAAMRGVAQTLLPVIEAFAPGAAPEATPPPLRK